jgi:23S rRNA (guanosine2251-2'-O)-methyltransferase
MAAPDHLREAEDTLLGPHAVREALRAGSRQVDKIFLARDLRGAVTREILNLARQAGVPVKALDRRALSALVPGLNHQGVVAAVAAVPYRELPDLLDAAKGSGRPPLLLVLDAVVDPRNVGALARTAEAAGAHGLVLLRHHAAGVTPAAAKAAAGAFEHLPVARVGNLDQALASLQGAGLWVVGADPAAPLSCDAADLTGPIALVVGGEGKGLRPLTRRRCDLLVRIPTMGRLPSLNASVAGGILLYEVVRQRLRQGPQGQGGQPDRPGSPLEAGRGGGRGAGEGKPPAKKNLP